MIAELKANHYLVEVNDEDKEFNDCEIEDNDKKYKHRIIPDAIVYKFAFGQKIPMDFDWKMKQPEKDEKEMSNKKDIPNKRPYDVSYDQHGRPVRSGSKQKGSSVPL